MIMRGIRTEGLVSSLITRGAFADRPDLRADFLQLAERKTKGGSDF
jgi:hypothetical protein